MAMSVEIGLLPPDTVVISGKNKKRKEPHSPTAETREPSHMPALLEAAAVANAHPPFVPPLLDSVSSSFSAITKTTDPVLKVAAAVSKVETSTLKEAASDSLTFKPRGSRPKQTERKKPVPKQKPAKFNVVTSAFAAASSKKSREKDVAPMSDDEEDEKTIPYEPMIPETALDPDKHVSAPPHTIHWDPHDRDGTKVGWKIRVQVKSVDAGSTAPLATASGKRKDYSGGTWLEGRVVRYDPYYHKHKIEFTTPVDMPTNNSNTNRNKRQKQSTSAWIWLRNQEHNLRLATKIVWAHVKGYAWWPALVIESNNDEDQRAGSVHVEFFGSDEVAWLKNTIDTTRPFSPNEIDPIVAKHKKKRNAKAFELACEEYDRIRDTRNQAAVFYAERAIDLAQRAGKKPFVAKRVQLHRHDVNYPYGETLNAKVRAYSPTQKKWLVSFDIAEKSKVKYDACWINLLGKDVSNLHVLNKSDQTSVEDLVPFVYAYEMDNAEQAEARPSGNNELVSLLQDTCRGCVEYWKGRYSR
jgi:hypothetical protein